MGYKRVKTWVCKIIFVIRPVLAQANQFELVHKFSQWEEGQNYHMVPKFTKGTSAEGGGEGRGNGRLGKFPKF